MCAYEKELVPDYGDLMTLQEFIDCCKCGGFIDYDGFGEYSDGVYVFKEIIYPSDVLEGNIKDYSHIVWYNR